MAFLNNREDAEDLVQEMYLRLHGYHIKFSKIKYKDEVNRYFIYTVLKNMALQFIRKKVYTVEIQDVAADQEYFDDKEEILIKIQQEVDTWDFYDRVLFETYMYSGLSLRDLAYGTDKKPRMIANTKYIKVAAVKNGTGISVSSMFNTIKKLKERLKYKIDYNETKRFKEETPRH